MIQREEQLKTLSQLLHRYPVVAVVGARQVGKSTLARQLVDRCEGETTIFDLEDPTDFARLADPMLALRERSGLIVLDEIQQQSELFPVLRVLADRSNRPATFLILGSASPHLLQKSSESLAGRIAYHELEGFSLAELGADVWSTRWLRGGYPPAYLAETLAESSEWRRQYIRTFLERDIPNLGISIPAMTLRRFWTMLAHWHGQNWNGAEFARSFGVADTTVRRYLDLLTSTFVVRQLQPWHANIAKRQVRSPRIYLRDSGILHTLLNLEGFDDLEGHPKVGASWEGFALGQVVARLGARPEECYFWSTHSGAELDLLVVRGNQRRGIEFKRTSAPRITRSMRISIEDLDLQSLEIIYPGTETFPLTDRIRAVPLSRLLVDLEPLT